MLLPKGDALQLTLVSYAPLAVIAYCGLPEVLLKFYLAHPRKLILATFAVPFLALIYTGPKSPVRLAVPAIIAIGASCYHVTSPYFMLDRTMAGLFAIVHMLFFLSAIDQLLIRRLSLDTSGDGQFKDMNGEKRTHDAAIWTRDSRSRTSLSLPTWSALAWAAHTFFSYRAIGTSREAKNTPSFPGRHVPSRPKFLLYRGCAIVGASVFADYLNHMLPPSPDTFAAHKSRLLLSKPDITMEIISVRVISTAVFWIALRASLGLLYNLTSFIAVATLLTAPEGWPPVFGRWTKAYTLRRFWALFWHSILRNSLLGVSTFITHDVLRMRRDTLAARYAKLWLVFGVSGIIHLFFDDLRGIPFGENTAYKFFLLQALGITLEDFAEWGFRSIRLGRQPTQRDEKLDGKGGVERAEKWQKAMGYIWVTSWLVLTTPAWSYQNIRHTGSQIFPLSLTEIMQALTA